MAIGPVRLLVLGFSHPNFSGEVIAGLERLKQGEATEVWGQGEEGIHATNAN